MTVSLPSIHPLVISAAAVLFIATALTVFSSSVMIPPAIAAQEGFTVSGISVDVTAASPAEARRRAFAKAEAEAVRQLLERLTVPAARTLLPVAIDDAIVQGLVRDVAIEEEKNATAHYVARLSVRFRPIAVHAYLKTLGASYVEPLARPVLIIPLFQESIRAAPHLWEKKDPWWAAWQRVDANRLVPIVVPSGDPGERDTLSPTQIIAEPATLETMVRRWGAERALVVHTIVLDAGENGPPPAVEVRTLQPGDLLLPPLIDRITGNPGDTLTTVLDRATQTVVERLETEWRQQEDTIRTTIRQGKEKTLTLMLSVTSLAEWLEIRQKLQHVPLIIHTDLQALTRTLIQLHLRYAGEDTQLAAAMAQHGLKLDGYGPVRQLERTKAAPPPIFTFPTPTEGGDK